MQAIQEMETVEKRGDISDAAAMVRLTTQIHCMHGETEDSTSEIQCVFNRTSSLLRIAHEDAWLDCSLGTLVGGLVQLAAGCCGEMPQPRLRTLRC